MYDFQNLPIAKQTIRLRGTFQKVSKACISWHDYVGRYDKKKVNKKLELDDFLEMYESLEIHEFLIFVNLWDSWIFPTKIQIQWIIPKIHSDSRICIWFTQH